MCMTDSKAAFKISALPKNCSHGYPYETVCLADTIPHGDKKQIICDEHNITHGFLKRIVCGTCRLEKFHSTKLCAMR